MTAFSKHYQNELAFLREMGREFGQTHPSIGGMLAERGGDPDVERLLEGFAFLAARIRERIDAAVPEVVHGLTDLLLPHYLRPLPAATVVELTPQKSLKARYRVAKGTPLGATPVDGTTCVFRTGAELELIPASVSDVAMEHPTSATPLFRVGLQLGEGTAPEILTARGLRLYFHGELAQASTLFLSLVRHCRSVEVKKPGGGAGVRLPPSCLKPVGFDDDQALFPWGPFAAPGYRLLQEYFTLPQKLLFLDVEGLDRAAGVVDDGALELRFELERPPPLPTRLTRDAVKVNCVPAVNLFAADAEPMRVSAPEEEHLLRAADVDPQHMEIYSVDSVVGLRAGRAERTTYHPFVDFQHAGAERTFFQTRRVPSPINDGIDVFLSLMNPRDARAVPAEETLSVSVTCTNRSLPRRLRVGDVSRTITGSPTVAKFTNLTPIAGPVRPPMGAELHWRLLSHLGLNRRSLATPEGLRALLSLYNFHLSGDAPEARAIALKCDAVREVTPATARHLLHGALVLGQRTEVTVAEGAFAGIGDAFLFGCVLDGLFAGRVTLNSFHALSMRLSPSREELTWPARSGSQMLL